MSRRKTLEEFIKEAKEVHGDKYDYSKVNYINTHELVTIICPIHGEFQQSPKSHLHYGCQKCARMEVGKKNTKTTEEFIEKAKEIHGNKYDYSKSIYKGARIPLTIICSKHGEFQQKPMDHLQNKGCPFCNESHLEKEVKETLSLYNIDFVYQYKNKGILGRQSLDFYLPKYNIGIECQGKQHFGIGGWNNSFDKLYEADERKYQKICNSDIKMIYLLPDEISKESVNHVIYKDYLMTIREFNEFIKNKI